MKDLIKFVDVWEKSGTIDDILSQNLALPPSHKVQAYLSSLPEADHARIRKSLTGALAALNIHTALTEREAARLKDQIALNIQASNACLSYNKATIKKTNRT